MLAAMRLVLVRHAEAAPGEPDELRTLTAAGRLQARLVAVELASERLDAVLSSPLVRAVETARAIASAAGLEVTADDMLAPGASVNDVLAAVGQRGQTVVVVGHNPDCQQIAIALGADAPHRFPPAAYTVIDLPA
jgi:phosphohistidine phosphatase SixA